MKATTNYKRTILPLAVIAFLALVLSILSYQYAQSSVAAAGEIASEDIKNNAEIQARDLAIMLGTRLEAVDSNLQLLSTAPSIRSSDDARELIAVAQSSTDYLTKFYMLLDSDGSVLEASGRSENEHIYYLGMGDRDYFTIPQQTLAPYVSDIVRVPESSFGSPIVYISYPVIDARQIDPTTGRSPFLGVAAAAIDTDISRQLTERTTTATSTNYVNLVDRDGTILYSNTESLVGINIMQEGETLWPVPDFEKASLANMVTTASSGKSVVGEFTVDGTRSTIFSEPVISGSRHLWTVYVTAPHNLSNDIIDLFNQQSFFSALSLMIITSVTVGIGIVIISWNKQLARVVDDRTAELRSTNSSLTEANALLSSFNEQLSANEKLQKEFINVASHEIKTPAQAILFHSELLKHSPQNPESLQAVVRNAERLQRLTNNILDVTRIESQTLRLSKEQFNLADVVLEVVKEYDDIIRNNVHASVPETRLECESDDVIVNADKARITQVLTNLLANAVAFAKGGKVTVSCSRTENDALVQVKDDGIGIDPEIIPRLFTKFATKSDKGTGLGLFVSKSIIDAHGGRIWAANNEVERGATFAFTIPAAQVD